VGVHKARTLDERSPGRHHQALEGLRGRGMKHRLDVGGRSVTTQNIRHVECQIPDEEESKKKVLDKQAESPRCCV